MHGGCFGRLKSRPSFILRYAELIGHSCSVRWLSLVSKYRALGDNDVLSWLVPVVGARGASLAPPPPNVRGHRLPLSQRHLLPFTGGRLRGDARPLLPGDTLHGQALRLRCYHEAIGAPVQGEQVC